MIKIDPTNSGLKMKQNNIKLCLIGSSGRMGQECIKQANARSSIEILHQINSASGKHDIIKALKDSDAAIDFSTNSSTNKLLDIYLSENITTPLLICTTALDDIALKNIDLLSKTIAISLAPNTSLGANFLMEMAALCAKKFINYDIEIIDKHHRGKLDAPSGTAMAISKAIAEAKSLNAEEVIVLGRSGLQKRGQDEIGISSIRAGNIFGEHEVIFAGDSEIFSVSHKALNRSIFADGALNLAAWLRGKAHGKYSVKDFLKLP